MKKFFCILLSLLFVLSFSVSSLAATVTDSYGNASFDLNASYISATQSDTYSVEITWGSMDFVYNAADEVWDPNTHSYKPNEEPTWTCDEGANVITVTNHSSKPITASFAYTAVASYSEIKAKFDNSTLNLGAPAENSKYSDAPTGTATVTLEGALEATAPDNVKLGSITVTISSASGGSPNQTYTTASATTTNSTAATTSGGNLDTTTPVGYLNLLARLSTDTTDIKYDIYKKSDDVYVTEFTASAEAEMDSSVLPDTVIHINGTDYYIYEEENIFTPGSTVNIDTKKYPVEFGTPKKSTAVVAGTRYRMTIDLSDMTATLEII